jgi:tetratricopeptide (TPR) repeat protein
MLLSTGIVLGLNACASPGRVTAYDLGVELQDKGAVAAAIEQYKEVLLQHPRHLRARFNLAVLYHDQKNYAAAKQQYQQLLQQYPGHARSLVNLADIAVAEDDAPQAYALLLQAVQAEPDRAYPYSYLGRYLQEQGRLLEAQAAYERALAIEADALTHYRLGMLQLQQGNPAAAMTHFTTAVQLDPNESKALYQLAMLTMEAGKHAEAIRYLQRLTHLTPQHAEVFIWLGKLYLQQGQYSAAVLHLWEARDLQPDSAEVAQLLLQAYQKLLQQQETSEPRVPTPQDGAGERH